MRSVWLALAIAVCVSCPYSVAANQPGNPNLEGLRLVAQLPAELPQRVSGFAYDGEKLWVTIYHGQGRYATLNPATLKWEIGAADESSRAISKAAGAFASPGGICFIEGKLWVAGSYGGSFGSVDRQSWKVEHLFEGSQRNDKASQSYAGMAFDGSSLWIAWHWFKYKLAESETQLLLKIDPQTGKVMGEYPLPAGTRNDGVHGLTWDGVRLWHMKDNRLSAIDSFTGAVSTQYTLHQIVRPSGLAWDGEALWIVEFDGKVWRLPFQEMPT
jgi:hypothetical protein